MFTLILGKDDDSIVDEDLVGILDSYNTRCNTPSFKYAQELAIGMRCQSTNFDNNKVFRYPSYLVYLFIFDQSADLYHLNLPHHDGDNPTNFVEWFPWVKRGDPESSMFK